MLRPRHLLFLLLVAIVPLLTSCHHSPSSAIPARGLPRSGRPDLDTSRLEERIHDLINRERKSHALPPMVRDEALTRIARGHSKDMAARGYFAHESPEGRDFSYRYRQAHFDCAVTVGQTVYLGAENIALNNLAASVTTVNGVPYFDWNSEETIARTTVRGWMNSAGHRRNILTPHWKKEGIGVQIAPDDRIYITQNFC